MIKTDVLIIGAGAAGVFAAIQAAKRGRKVVVLEHLSKPLKKILATGNGKCNFTNLVIDEKSFRGNDAAFAYEAMKAFGPTDSVQFFEKAGVLVKNRDGYMYPSNEQASSIRTALLGLAESLGVKIVCDVMITALSYDREAFTVTAGDKYVSKSLIIAAGGAAAKAHGSDGSGYGFAKRLGHKVYPVYPALTALYLEKDMKTIKKLSGVRATSKITLSIDGNTVASESGEIIFNQKGLSGIPVMQTSRYVSSADFVKQNVRVSIDYVPEISKDKLLSILADIRSQRGSQCCFDAFSGIVNNKLANELMLQADIKGDSPANDVSDKKLAKLASLMKNMEFNITGVADFDSAQATMGGVSTAELNVRTMESKLHRGLYFAGEIVDIDGNCGGYNLQWAWTSGFLAGNNA